MKAYRTYSTVSDLLQVVLKDVPFQPGERVEVLLLVRSEDDTASAQALEALLRTTQALPHMQVLTDDDIAAEVAAYRHEP